MPLLFDPNDPAIIDLLAPQQHPLDNEIRKYLGHLANHLKSPIEINVRARAVGIATDIRQALLAYEQRALVDKEDLAAHELADPHTALSIEVGRQELAEFIAAIALPLADNTWAQDMYIDIRIGRDLPPPFALYGMAMCIELDCRRGIIRQRFAPDHETECPDDDQSVTVGMTLVCRPGKLGSHQIHEEKGRDSSMALLQSDAALYRWTIHTLSLLGYLQAQQEEKLEEAEAKILQVAITGFRTSYYILRLVIKANEAAAAAAVVASAATIATPPQLTANLIRLAEPLQKRSPELAVALDRLKQELKAIEAKATPAVPNPARHIAHPTAEPSFED